MDFIKKLVSSKNPNSLGRKLRKRRFKHFLSLIKKLPRPLIILDVGGTQAFWESMNFDEKNITIYILNLKKILITSSNFKGVIGNVRNMKRFKNKEFDIVFSNATIEHVGDLSNQRKMATEAQRVGKYYFIHSPNRYFPTDPHFFLPFFPIYPLALKLFLIMHFNIGWYNKANNKTQALKIINSVRLLSKKELIKLFPKGRIIEEKFLGFKKSFIIHNIY